MPSSVLRDAVILLFVVSCFRYSPYSKYGNDERSLTSNREDCCSGETEPSYHSNSFLGSIIPMHSEIITFNNLHPLSDSVLTLRLLFKLSPKGPGLRLWFSVGLFV